MNLLIPHGRAADKYLVQAAQGMGHRVHLMCNLQERSRLGGVDQECLPDVWVQLSTRFDLKLSHEEYLKWYHEQIRTYVTENNIEVILPCSSMDLVLDEVAQVNEEFDLPGIRPEQSAFFRDKTVYLPAMAEAGIKVPEIYEIVEPSDEPKNYDLPYPVIAKPGLGCGGYGIFIAKDADALRWFFNHSDDPDSFSKRALFYQDKDFAGRPKSYLHFGFGGRYLIQEYVDGPCVSIAGTTVDGVPKLNMAYDIGITPPPTCAEINFAWPSKQSDASFLAQRLADSLGRNKLEPPNGAWMADAILRGGELWLVDFAPRMSSSGTKMLYHACGDLSYPTNILETLVGGSQKCKVSPDYRRSVYYSFIPFPKGKLTNIRYPDASKLDEVVTPISGEGKVFEMRNDVQVADRGWVVATGRSRDDAQMIADQYINAVEYDLNAIVSTAPIEHTPIRLSPDDIDIVALDTRDRNRVLKLIGECNLDPDQWQGLEEDLWLYLEGISGNLWGYFDDGELVATMGTRIWPDAPYYVIHSIMTNRRGKPFDPVHNGLFSLYTGILTTMEAQQYYRYYGHLRLNIFRMFRDLWPIHIPMIRRYEFVVEEVIPTGQISKYPMFSGLITQKVFDQPYVIRSGTLRQQYRTEEFQI